MFTSADNELINYNSFYCVTVHFLSASIMWHIRTIEMRKSKPNLKIEDEVLSWPAEKETLIEDRDDF